MKRIIRRYLGKVGKKHLLIGVGAIAIVLGFSLIWVKSDIKISESQHYAADQAKLDDKAVLEKLKKIILLPEDVTPTMAILTDVELLRSHQPGFFANAKNGERLIIYPQMALIYDVEENKIIKAGGIELVGTPDSEQPTTVPTKPSKNEK